MGGQANAAKDTGAELNEQANEEKNRLAAMSIEESFSALDDLIDRLESGQGSLEEAFACYEEGMKLVKSCNAKIEKIEKQVLVLSGPEGEEDASQF